MSAYREITQDAVRTFLQNVVIVDNEATYEPEVVEVENLEAPSPRGSAQAELATDGEEVARSNVLNAKILTESFAGAGLVCSVLRPSPDDDLTQQIIKAAGNSDIFVVDWDLVTGDGGTKAKGIIKAILEADVDRAARLRLIAIYTAETNTGGIRDAVLADLKTVSPPLEAEDEPLDGSVTCVAKNGNVRIVVIRKGAADDGPGGLQVGEAHLAERLIEEFSLLAHGILPTVGLACISAIRNETYHLLSRFHAGLDASYLLHRCMLSQPDDAESFAAELVGSEIHAIIEAHVNLAKYVGEAAVHANLTDMANAGHSFDLPVGNIPDKKLDLERIKILASKGKSAVGDFTEVSKSAFGRFKQAPHKSVKRLLHADENVSENANLEFARVSSFKRESWGSSLTPKDWDPKLSRGTVVRRNADDDDRYWVCLQPLCDCVRIDTESPFLFAELRISNGESFDLVARNAINEDVKLVLETAPGKLLQIAFMGSEDHGHVVIAQLENGKKYFFSGDRKYEWIGDLRSAIASRIVHQVTTQLSRVGLDEFEWQRLQAAT